MAEKDTILCKKRGNNLKRCIERYNLKQKDLEKPIDKEGHVCCTESDVSSWIHGRKLLTESKISDLLRYIPEFKDVKKDFLLGDSEYMTAADYERDRESHHMTTYQASKILIEDAMKEVCKMEGLSIPEDSPEINFLELQLKDEALKIVWSYLHSNSTPMWEYIKNFRPPIT